MSTIGRFTAALLVTLGFAGCYDQDVQPSLGGVYSCQLDRECAVGSACLDEVCTPLSTVVDPELEVLNPPQLQVFQLGQAGTIPITLIGSGLSLGDDGDNPGYVDILLDGAAVASVVAGDLESGIENSDVPFPALPGLHHLTLIARKPDGQSYDGTLASTTIGFWVDDGNEHMGILSPAPGTTVTPETPVELVSLNLTLANPSFTNPDVESDHLAYAHVYLDAMVPSCLPACNEQHQVVAAPSGLSRVNRMTVDNIGLQPKLGTTQVQVVAQAMRTGPYSRQDATLVSYGVSVHVGEEEG